MNGMDTTTLRNNKESASAVVSKALSGSCRCFTSECNTRPVSRHRRHGSRPALFERCATLYAF